MPLRQRVNDILGRRGYEMRRHPATRRQQMLVRHGVDLVFDVGAAKGAYGAELRAFGYQGKIVSFEPLSKSFTELTSASSTDALWVATQCALGSEVGEAQINVADNADSSSLLPMLDTHRDAAPHVRFVAAETIKVSRLDDVAAEHLARSTAPFLKIDTQGFERQVIEGAHDTVKALVGLQLELSFVPLYEGGMTADQAISWAYEEGFALVGFEAGLMAQTGQLMQADGVFFRVPRLE